MCDMCNLKGVITAEAINYSVKRIYTNVDSLWSGCIETLPRLIYSQDENSGSSTLV